MEENTSSPVDMLIIGGGPAGLATAVGVARNQHTAIVFDSGEYRNEGVSHFHLLPTWDNKSPQEFRAAARQNTLDNYSTISYVDTKIEQVKEIKDGFFEVKNGDGKSWFGKSLVLATGIQDIFPDIEGYGDCWGESM